MYDFYKICGDMKGKRKMISHAIIFLVLSSLSALGIAMSSKSQYKFEEYLPVSCCGIVLILFGFGLAGVLKAGVYFICVLSVLLYIISALMIIKRKAYVEFAKRFFTLGFLIFAFLYVGLTYLNNDRVAWAHDEFSHWADVVKAMFMIDDLSTSNLSNCFFQSYPPGMALFQYLMQKIHQMVDSYPGFSEWRLYFAYQIFSCSFFFPFLKLASFKKCAYTLLTFAMVCLSPMILFGYYYPRMIMIDPFVSVVAGSGFALLYVRREKSWLDYVQLFMIIAILVLAKDVGLILAIFLSIAMIMDETEILRQSKYCRKEIKIRVAAVSTIALLSVVLPKVLWNWSIAVNGARKSFSQPIELNTLMKILLGEGNSFHYDVITSYVQRFFEGTWVIGIFEIQMSWAVILVLLTAALCAIHFACQKREYSSARNKIVFLAIFQIIVYIIGLLILYLFRYSEYEARNLASYDRYLSVSFQTVLIMCVLIVFDYIHRFSDEFYHMGALMILLVLVTLPVSHVQEFFNKWSVESSHMVRDVYEGISAHMLDITQNEQKKVYIISQESRGTDYYILRYSIRPCMTNDGGNQYYPDGPRYEGDIWTTRKTAEQWQAELVKENYDYVLLFKMDDNFLKNYGSIFANPEEVVDYTIYSVDHHTGLLSRCW